MLPKRFRLPSSEIAMLARRGKRIGNTQLDIRAWYDDTLPQPIFAISIAKKVDNKAVIRNKIKRKLRAALIQLLTETPTKNAPQRVFRPGRYLILPRALELKDIEQQVLLEMLAKLFR